MTFLCEKINNSIQVPQAKTYYNSRHKKSYKIKKINKNFTYYLAKPLVNPKKKKIKRKKTK